MGVCMGYYQTSIPRPELCYEAQQPLQMPEPGAWSGPDLAVLTGCKYGILFTGTILVRHQCSVAKAANLSGLNCWMKAGSGLDAGWLLLC